MQRGPAHHPTSAGLERSFWRRDDRTELVDFTVGALLAQRARSHPDTIALVGTRHGSGVEIRRTYAELYDDAARTATGLTALLQRGSYVAIWAPNAVEWTIIQYGAALAGMVLVALNPALREQELEYAVRHSGASLLLYADRSHDHDMTAVVRNLNAKLPDLQCVSLSDGSAWQAQEADRTVLESAPTDPDDVVMLQYTSGTTGRPKGVLLKHRSLINVAKLTLEAVEVEPGAICLNPLPLFHTAGCVIATLGPLWIAGTLVLVERFKPGPVLDALRRENATVLFYVPAVLGALLEAQRSSDAPPPQLRTIMGGASSVPAAMIESAETVFGATVINLFGQTELSPVLSATRPGDTREDQLNTVGRPLPQVDCKVVDPNSGATLPIGEPGEICARGFQQFVGYLDDAEATSRAVDAEGFVHTGDLGTMDARGYLTVTGRLKELIIRGGENIAPAEIEMALAGHDAVIDAAVIGLPDDRWGEIVAAVLRVRAHDHSELKTEVTEYLASRIARFKMPTRWFITDQMPVTPTGKVRKFELRDAVLGGRVREL
jgi:fatty-acyl-CoA synthase